MQRAYVSSLSICDCKANLGVPLFASAQVFSATFGFFGILPIFGCKVIQFMCHGIVLCSMDALNAIWLISTL